MQECLKENISVEVFKRKYISGRGNFPFYKPRSKELAQENIFYFVVLSFKAERFSLELHLTKYVNGRYTSVQFSLQFKL